MNKTTTDRKAYEPPRLTVVTFKIERGYAVSGEGPLAGVFRLGNSFSDGGGDAWDGSSSGSGGNRFGGGWTDNGESAW